MELIVKEKFTITGRGDVYTLSLKENGLSNKSGELQKLFGQECIINKQTYIIKGFESFGLWDDEVKDDIGLLVKVADMV